MWSMKIHICLSIIFPQIILGNELILQNDEDNIQKVIIDVLKIGKQSHWWKNAFIAGRLPDSLFRRLQEIPSTFTVITEGDEDDVETEHVMPYPPHTAIFQCYDFEQLEELLMKTITSPYWHPLTNVILLYESNLTNDLIAKILFIFWYYKACYVVIVQFEDSNKVLLTHYNPYIMRQDLPNFGCRTANKIGIPFSNFNEGFACEEGCHNITRESKFRANNLGTCISFQTDVISLTDQEPSQNLNLFEDVGKNLHGFSLRAYISEVKPFMTIDVFDNGTCVLGSRDGMLWNTVSEVMNFTIDFTPSAATMKLQFDFERTIQHLFAFSHRKADLFLIPIYQFDLIIVILDHTFPIKESGLCLMSQRAGFETSLFDSKLLMDNNELLIEFIFCFLCVWFIFFIFNALEKDKIGLDQIGKDLVNAFRSILSISLYKAPKNKTFRIYLSTSIWCFFVLNFFTQAAIISFFSSFRRGKDVNTFEDVIEKGYPIEGLASPDSFLPETEERFNKLTSKLVSVRSLFECAENMLNDSHRFCLIDCAIGRYLERNKLNNKGEQYLHIAKKDRFHSHYLNMIFPKHSPLTEQYNKIVMRLFEAGLIRKWEEYRFTDIKEEAQVKSLGLEDLLGIFKCYGMLVFLCIAVFFIELFIGFQAFLKRFFTEKLNKWKRTRIAKKKVKLEKKLGKIKQMNSYTQT